MHFYMNVKRSFFYLILFTLSVNESWSRHSTICGNNHLVGPKGNISSPHYPVLHKLEVFCTWNILSPPETTLKIRISDFDVPQDTDCTHPPCCNNNWLSVPVNGKAGVYQQICGNLSESVRTVSQNNTVIMFHYSSINDHFQRGFHLTYSIEKKDHHCEDYQFLCKDSTCLHMSMKCDGVVHCTDGDDEIQCLGTPKCPVDEIMCGPLSEQCFKQSELCDGYIQCPFGEDEFGCNPECKHGISCLQGEGCYLPSQRCDGRSDCADDSDESMCPDELCPVLPNKRQCRNGHCIQSRLWCDGSDDCGDFSDEEACLKNSVITVAIMGALFGGLILVLAVGCSLRYYSRRYSESRYQERLSPPGGGSRFRMPHSLSLPAFIDNEFFNREPPPVYSVAVGNSGVPRRCRSNRSRSSRRGHHSHRHTLTIPKPPSDNILNTGSSPSSEDSLLPAYSVTANTDDNEQLLTA